MVLALDTLAIPVAYLAAPPVPSYCLSCRCRHQGRHALDAFSARKGGLPLAGAALGVWHEALYLVLEGRAEMRSVQAEQQRRHSELVGTG